MNKSLLLVTAEFFLFSLVNGQQYPEDHDTSYYKTYPSMLTARGYLSRKYTVLEFIPSEPLPVFNYRASTSLNLGIGATYHAFTLNIGVGITRFDPEHEKGSTKYLDLQGHYYARKWNIDLLGEFYKGYYLSPEGLAAPTGKDYYTRPDIGLSLVGFAFYRCLNENKFSYQAGLLQNEWQKKSAGSILAGGEIYYGAVYGDSTLSPTLIDPHTANLSINKFHFLNFGPGVGYAYTFVYKENFFILGSATMNLSFRYSQEISSSRGQQTDLFDFLPNYLLRAGAGYNGNKWSLSLLWVNTKLFMRGEGSGYHYSVDVGNYRLVYARRLNPGRKTRKILEPIPKIIGQ